MEHNYVQQDDLDAPEEPEEGVEQFTVKQVDEPEPHEVKVMNPKAFKWTVTNKKSYNLPQIYMK